MTLTIIGLGSGNADDLTRRAWQMLEAAATVYLRTSQRGSVTDLPQNATYHNFDDLYQSGDDLETVYATVVERLLDAAKTEDVVYAVPGDPLVDEPTTAHILEQANAAGIDVEIINGISVLEPALALLEMSARDGLQILNGTDIAAFYHPPVNPDLPAIITQVNSRQIAADLQKTLRNQYQADFMVKLVRTDAGQVDSVPLDELDQQEITPGTVLYLPALGEMTSFEQFQAVIAHLRAPEGCPWDRKQTHESLRQYMLEEAYEVLEAIDSGDPKALYEELGDLMLQIVLHTQIAIDNGTFNMTDVLRNINQKMVRRHPHVFSTTTVEDADEVVVNWQAIKQQEKAEKGQVDQSILDGVPKILPALQVAYEYQARAAKVGFDWDEMGDVRAKIDEELDETLAAETDAERADEIGDVIFVMVNWARWLGIDPETALRDTNAKFYRRFSFIEERVRESDKPMTDYTLAELDAFWDEAKANRL